MRGTLCLTFTNLNVMTSYICSTILLDILTIFSPSITLNLRNILLMNIQLDFSWIKQILQTKKFLFLDLNIKVIGSEIHTSVYDKCDDFGFPILICHGWLVTFQDDLRYLHFAVGLLGVVLAFWFSILKISKLLQNCWHRVIDNTSFEKHLESSLHHTPNFCQNLVIFRSKNISQKKSLTPAFYGDLVNNLRRVKDTTNFISSCSIIVKRLRRRQYDPLIIERTIGIVLCLSTALYRPSLKHCILTNKAVGTIWRALSKPPLRRQGPDIRPLWLLVGTSSFTKPELASRRAEHSLPYSDVAIYIYIFIIFITYAVCVLIFMTSSLGMVVGLLFIFIRSFFFFFFFYKFLNVSFWLPECCGDWEGWARKPFNHTSLLAVVTPTDRPKWLRNRCTCNRTFCGVVCVVTYLLV